MSWHRVHGGVIIMSFQIVLIIHMLLAFGLIALILMQHGKGADAGAAFGAGASGSVFGARGANSFMYKLTASIAVGFFITTYKVGLFRSVICFAVNCWYIS
jgi:preprotein translocase subunit SecG